MTTCCSLSAAASARCFATSATPGRPPRFAFTLRTAGRASSASPRGRCRRRWGSCAIEIQIGRSGPNLEPGTMRVYVTNGPRNGLDIGTKVGPCPGSKRRWVLGSVHAFSQAVHAANANRPKFQVRTCPS